MHNGVLHTCIIDGHDVEIRSQATMVGLNTNGCIHTPSEYVEYALRIDGYDVHPPAVNWTDENGLPFPNMRLGAFDTAQTAFRWAWYTITGNRHEKEDYDRFLGTLALQTT
jgi:hypothetical protein